MNLEDLLQLREAICVDETHADKNLFDMTSFKEFRHSAIIWFLLNRKELGHRLYLSNFLERVLSENSALFSDEAEILRESLVDCPQSGGGIRRRPIDILVKDKNIALIIENKCREAPDQETQIADYWEGVKNTYHFEDDQLFVLYIPPLNSFVGPSDVSLGNLKDRLGENGDLRTHLTTISFRDLVLPWLRDDVLPNLSFGNGILVNSLRCYIDFLEGLFGERKGIRDARVLALSKFKHESPYQTFDDQMLWNEAERLLNNIENVRKSTTGSTVSETSADGLDDLHRTLWGIKTLLLEKVPLLDPLNFSWEVYWLLRGKPTAFAARSMTRDLDSGLFFKTGKNKSAWDGPMWNNHHLECWFHHDEFAKYCRNEECGTILTFGIGDVGESDFPKMQTSFGDWTEYFQSNKWRSFGVSNIIFRDAKHSQGGEMLWKVAEQISEEANRFSKAFEAEVNENQ